jgi:hypothetical protein
MTRAQTAAKKLLLGMSLMAFCGGILGLIFGLLYIPASQIFAKDSANIAFAIAAMSGIAGSIVASAMVGAPIFLSKFAMPIQAFFVLVLTWTSAALGWAYGADQLCNLDFIFGEVIACVFTMHILRALASMDTSSK